MSRGVRICSSPLLSRLSSQRCVISHWSRHGRAHRHHPSQFELAPGAEDALRGRCDTIAADGAADAGNGRAVRNIIEGAMRAQAMRLAALTSGDVDAKAALGSTISPKALSELTAEDINVR